MRMTYATRPRAKWLTPALAVIVAAFLLYSLPPYFTGGTRVPATFALHYPLLVAHVMFGSVAMVYGRRADLAAAAQRVTPCCTVAPGACTSPPRSRPRHARW